MRDYIRKVNEKGAVVTVNVKIYTDGSFSEAQKASLQLSDL
jgi:hypothetical protein